MINKCIKNIFLLYHTASLCNFLPMFSVYWLVSGLYVESNRHVASYIEGKETSHTPPREYTKILNRAILKCVTFFSGSCGNESHYNSAAVRYASRPGNGSIQGEVHQIVLSQSLQPNVKSVFPNEIKGKAIPLEAWIGIGCSWSLGILDFKTFGTWTR